MFESVTEHLDERRAAVALAEAEVQVRVTYIEVQPDFRIGVEDRSEILRTREKPVEVLDHQSDSERRRILGEFPDRNRVHLSYLVLGMKGNPLVGVDIHQRDPRIGEAPETLLIEIARRGPQFGERRCDREVPGGMSHEAKAEITGQASYLLAVRKPRGRRFQGEVTEVETVFGDPVQFLCHRTSWEVHRAYEHPPIVVDPLVPHYPDEMETYEAIVTRRSVPKVKAESPSRDNILKILEAGVRAPTHHLTQPWRFVVLTGDARAGLGEAWAAGEEANGRDAEAVRHKPLRAPVIITVIATPKSHLPKVIELEEHHAVGAAIQNILLAAHDLGLGAMIRTGRAREYAEVEEFFGVGLDEYIAGMIYVGYPEADERPMTRRTPASELTEWRGWS